MPTVTAAHRTPPCRICADVKVTDAAMAPGFAESPNALESDWSATIMPGMPAMPSLSERAASAERGSGSVFPQAAAHSTVHSTCATAMRIGFIGPTLQVRRVQARSRRDPTPLRP